MIFEKGEDLLALLQTITLHLLPGVNCNKGSLLGLIPLLISGIVLFLLIDYGRMIYLHFQMVRKT